MACQTNPESHQRKPPKVRRAAAKLMNFICITLDEYTRLMDSILWILGPYLESEDPLSEHPHLFELAQSYSELLRRLPQTIEHNYPVLHLS